MPYPRKETVQLIREQFPVGCQVKLIQMDDVHAPPPGTKGIVRQVDDVGTIHVRWENGSSLGLAYGVDEAVRCDQ